MKTILAIVTTAAAVSASAQNYSIDWFTIDGGGGTSSGGVYSLSDTSGQPDAGATMTGGQYTLVGGFWALPFAVQDPGAPTLAIEPFGSAHARISWTPNPPGFVLQENANLNTDTWVNAPSGTSNPAIVPAPPPLKAYRLRRQ